MKNEPNFFLLMELISQLLKHKKQEPDQKEWHRLNNHWKFPFLLKARQKGWWDGLVRRKIGTLDPEENENNKPVNPTDLAFNKTSNKIDLGKQVSKRVRNQKIDFI